MAVSRPTNMPAILENYLMKQLPHPFEIRWLLMCQGPEPDPKGWNKYNEGAAMVQSGWIWMPSDDSLQYPNLFRRWGQVIEKNPNARAIVFSEQRKGHCPYTGDKWPSEPGILRASPLNMRPTYVDGTQLLFHVNLAPRLKPNTPGNQGDGILAQELFAKFPDHFVFCPDDFVVFGSLDR